MKKFEGRNNPEGGIEHFIPAVCSVYEGLSNWHNSLRTGDCARDKCVLKAAGNRRVSV